MKKTNNNRPALKVYHVNAEGTGSAVKLELIPSSPDNDGGIDLSIAPQGVGTTIKWDKEIRVNLDFSDICLMLQVFRGEIEHVNNPGVTHYGHGKMSKKTPFKLTHFCDERTEPGYSLELSSRGKNYVFFFKPQEALGVSVALENVLGIVAFGVPQKIG